MAIQPLAKRVRSPAKALSGAFSITTEYASSADVGLVAASQKRGSYYGSYPRKSSPLPSRNPMGGRGELFLSPQESMEIQKYSVLERVKRRKLAKNRKPCDLFRIAGVKFNEVFESKNAHVEMLPKKASLQKNKKQKRKELHDAQTKIFGLFAKEDVWKLSKKQRRRIREKQGFSDVEWIVFCTYANQCKRGRKEAKRRLEGKKRRTKYSTYINSPMWEDRKNKYYQSHVRICAACNSFKKIHLHHMVYGKYGEEPDDDLIPLCDVHHKIFHRKNGTTRDMKKETYNFVNEIRKSLKMPPYLEFIPD